MPAPGRQTGSQAARHKGTFLCFRTCLLDHLSFFLSFRLFSSTLLLLTTVARWSISFFIGIFFLFKGLSIKERFQIDSRLGYPPVLYTVGLQATFWNMDSNVWAILVVWQGKAAVDSLVDRLSKGGKPKSKYFSS